MPLAPALQIVLLVCALLLGLPVAARPDASTDADTVTVLIDGFQDLVWQPTDNYFRSPGPVRIELRSFQRGETMVLTADDAEGRPDGDIAVRGRFRLVRRRSPGTRGSELGEAVMTGRELRLNPVTETGSLLGAVAVVAGMRVRGDRLVMTPGRGIVATGASFTTCEKAAPDYRITARELSLTDTGRVTARGVTLWIRRTPLLVVPWMQKSFRQQVESPFPLPGYSKETGLKLRLRNEITSSASSALSYDVTAAFRSPPHGSLSFERALGAVAPDAAPPATRARVLSEPTRSALEMHPLRGMPDERPWDASHPVVVYAALGANEYVAHRVRTDLRQSRLPAIGVAGYGPKRDRPGYVGAAHLTPGEDREDGPGGGLGYHWDLHAGRYREQPTDVEASRAGISAGVALPGLRLISRLSMRAGLAASGRAYDTGQSHAIVAPECEAFWDAGRELGLGVAYKRQYERGRTPFAFDRSDIANEMRLYLRGDTAHWAYGLAVSYDMDRTRAYETSVTIKHKLDCMEFGLSYRSRSQGFGIIFNLLPGSTTGE